MAAFAPASDTGWELMNTECAVDVEQSRGDRSQGTVMLLKVILLSAVLIEELTEPLVWREGL